MTPDPTTAPTVPHGPVAYLTGHYPRASHTFILREVAALRRIGLEIRPCSVRRTPPGELVGAEERAAQDETFHVLASARNPFRLLSDHVAALLRDPAAYLGALWLAARTGRPGSRGALRQVAYFAEAGVLARHLAREGVVHLHNHFADSSANLAMIAARMARLPFSFTLHGPAELYEPESWHLGEKVRRAAFTVCISDFARSQAMLFSRREDWPRLHVVRCGIEPDRYRTGPAPVDGGPLRLLFVGRLTAIKGAFVLLEALEILRGAAIALTVVGDGPDRAALEREAQARRLPVRFAGIQSQSDVAEALARCDALVLPSLAEGVPVVLMEAMASARPVIATRVGGVAELVTPRAGWLVAPGNAPALADAIAALAGLPAEARREMGRAGRDIVRKAHDIDTTAPRLAALFAVAARGGAPAAGP